MPSETAPLRFLADMGVSWRVLVWLRDQGHEAVHLREEGLSRLPDELIFKKAQEEQRIILTFDLDFGEIAAFARQPFPGIVIFRLSDATSSHVISRLQIVLTECRQALDTGGVISVGEKSLRVRFFPANMIKENH